MEAQKIKKSFFVLTTLLIAGAAFAVFANDSNESEKNLFNDFDQDGLSNEEESRYGTDAYKADTDGDGYSDYTEISSGYNPLKPAPGDKIIEEQKDLSTEKESKKEDFASSENNQGSNDDSANLTQEAVAKIQGVMNSGDVESSEDMIEAFQGVIQEMLEQNTGNVTLPDVDVDSIKVKKQNYKKLTEEERKVKLKADDEEYMTAVMYIFTANMPQGTVPNAKNSEEFNTAADVVIQKAMSSFSTGDYKYINELSDSGERILEQMKDIEVPENMFSTHVRGTQLALYAAQIKDDVKPDSNDPIKSIMKMSKVQGFLQLVQQYVADSEKVFNGLKIEDILLTASGEDK